MSAVIRGKEIWKQGAEAKLYLCEFLGQKCTVKERFTKGYRHPELDKSLTHQRMKNEVRGLVRCRQHGIATPTLLYVDRTSNAIYMEYLEDHLTLKDYVNDLLSTEKTGQLLKVAEEIGKTVAELHNNNIIHGDLTTSNILAKVGDDDSFTLCLIDFGLSSILSAHNSEDKGVDLYVLERAFLSTHPNTEHIFTCIVDSYKKCNNTSVEVMSKLEEIQLRGRKRTMVG